jgi:ferredoxin-NAD(P)+ reductase (naphthalene dioxygenase ferredoxin-specific)
MDHAVLICQHPQSLRAEAGATILEAALAAGVAYPHGCRSGNCGGCKSRLHRGEIELGAYCEYALSEAERKEGLILACRATPWSDVTVSWLDADEIVSHPQRQLRCRVAGLDDLTHDIKRLRLKIETGGPFTFSAGQFASLGFAELPARDYSMANRPNDPCLEFHIRRMGQGASAYVADRLRHGDTVRVSGPLGSAFLRDQHRGPIIAIAGGSGLAPIKSIVETALAAGMRQPVHLYFGARDERDIYLERAFRALATAHGNFRFTPVLSAPNGVTARRRGLVHEAASADLGDLDLDGAKAYLAGPPAMVEAATRLLIDGRGMRRDDVHADAFYSEAEKRALALPAPAV